MSNFILEKENENTWCFMFSPTRDGSYYEHVYFTNKDLIDLQTLIEKVLQNK